MNADFRIKGAGPAGLTAAIALAREGASVDVYESREDCGARFHGDLQGIENWMNGRDFADDLRLWGIERTFSARPFLGATGIDDRGRIYPMSRSDPVFFVIRRGASADSLDQCLKTQALEAGARIHFAQPANDAEVDLVSSGPAGHPRRGLAVSEVFELDRPDEAYLLLDNRAASGGYAYLLIANGQACLASILFADFSSAHEQFSRAKARISRVSSIKFGENSPTGGFTTFSGTPRFRHGRQLFAGEAAGLQDPLWGFGVRNAMTSGYLAAQGLLGHLDFAAVAEAEFGPRVRAGVVNRRLWEKLGHPAYRAVLTGGARTRNLRAYLHRLCQPTIFHRALFPLASRQLHRRAPKTSTGASATIILQPEPNDP